MFHIVVTYSIEIIEQILITYSVFYIHTMLKLFSIAFSQLVGRISLKLIYRI